MCYGYPEGCTQKSGYLTTPGSGVYQRRASGMASARLGFGHRVLQGKAGAALPRRGPPELGPPRREAPCLPAASDGRRSEWEASRQEPQQLAGQGSAKRKRPRDGGAGGACGAANPNGAISVLSPGLSTGFGKQPGRSCGGRPHRLRCAGEAQWFLPIPLTLAGGASSDPSCSIGAKPIALKTNSNGAKSPRKSNGKGGRGSARDPTRDPVVEGGRYGAVVSGAPEAGSKEKEEEEG